MEEKPNRTRDKIQRCLAIIELAKGGEELQATQLADVFGVGPDTIRLDLSTIRQVLAKMPDHLKSLRIVRSKPRTVVRRRRKVKKRPAKKKPRKKPKPPVIRWVNTVTPIKPTPKT